ncbi:MAG TPA: transcriptional regulator, partial [Opitutales bacterium]|nr:transcriptional regulator [Opitutales bacterium]
MSKEIKASQPYFSLDDVEEILKRQKSDAKAKKAQAAAEAETRKNELKQDRMANPAEADLPSQQKLEAASMADILGFDPGEQSLPSFDRAIESVPKKFQSYYKQLIELKKQVLNGLDLHMQDTLKRSSKDDSGDLSSYGQHLADAGT